MDTTSPATSSASLAGTPGAGAEVAVADQGGRLVVATGAPVDACQIGGHVGGDGRAGVELAGLGEQRFRPGEVLGAAAEHRGTTEPLGPLVGGGRGLEGASDGVAGRVVVPLERPAVGPQLPHRRPARGRGAQGLQRRLGLVEGLELLVETAGVGEEEGLAEPGLGGLLVATGPLQVPGARRGDHAFAHGVEQAPVALGVEGPSGGGHQARVQPQTVFLLAGQPGAGQGHEGLGTRPPGGEEGLDGGGVQGGRSEQAGGGGAHGRGHCLSAAPGGAGGIGGQGGSIFGHGHGQGHRGARVPLSRSHQRGEPRRLHGEQARDQGAGVVGGEGAEVEATVGRCRQLAVRQADAEDPGQRQTGQTGGVDRVELGVVEDPQRPTLAVEAVDGGGPGVVGGTPLPLELSRQAPALRPLQLGEGVAQELVELAAVDADPDQGPPQPGGEVAVFGEAVDADRGPQLGGMHREGLGEGRGAHALRGGDAHVTGAVEAALQLRPQHLQLRTPADEARPTQADQVGRARSGGLLAPGPGLLGGEGPQRGTRGDGRGERGDLGRDVLGEPGGLVADRGWLHPTGPLQGQEREAGVGGGGEAPVDGGLEQGGEPGLEPVGHRDRRSEGW